MRILLLLCAMLLGHYAYANDSSNILQSLQPTTAPVLENADTTLSVDQAFVLNSQITGHQVVLTWQIYGEYYLYQKQFQLQLLNAPHAAVGNIDFPTPVVKDDPYFGKQNIYLHRVQLIVPIEGEVPAGAQLQVKYQGCSGTLCYPPQTVPVNLIAGMGQAMVVPPIQIQPVHSLWQHHNVGWVLLTLFGLGILLAFTPCVLPMIPILSSIIVGQGVRSSLGRATGLSLSYILGMAVTYAILGLIIARIGASVEGFLQQPWVLSLAAILMIILALSLFGMYRLQLPTVVQAKVAKLYPDHRQSTYLNVFIMGVLATLIISPCTSAPLVGVLGYVAQTGNTALGGLALFCLALGMGVPLLIVGMGAGRFLPKTGKWMVWVQRLLGVLMILVAFSLLGRFIPEFSWNHWTHKFIATESSVAFVNIESPAALQAQLTLAQQQHQPVLVDFYANWCVECHKMDAEVFTDANVKQHLAGYRLLRVDTTSNNADMQALMKQFDILGMPTLLIYDAQGQLVNRLAGFVDAVGLIKSL